MCNKHVHSAMTRSSGFHCVMGVIKNRLNGRVVYRPITYTEDLLLRNFLSSQCRNCSRDPNREYATFRGDFFIGRVGLAIVNQCTKFEVSRFTRYEAMNGSAKCRQWGGLG